MNQAIKVDMSVFALDHLRAKGELVTRS
jgi:hypothetical protein